MTLEAARVKKLSLDGECRDQDGFVQVDRSMSGLLFERAGLLPPIPSRWNDDGSWNW